MSTYTLESFFLKGDVTVLFFIILKSISFNSLNFRERERGKEREKKHLFLLFHLLMHSFVDSYMGPAWGLNLQPWPNGRML